MPQPYTEDVADQFDYESDWLEAVGDTGPGDAGLSNDGQEATLVGYVPWNKQRAAARYFLGFAAADGAAPWMLRRENPSRHPTLPWLYAHDVSFKSFVVKASDDNPLGEPWVDSPFATPLRTGLYSRTVATVRYRNFRCRFLEDSVLEALAAVTPGNYEYLRNTYTDTEASIEALSADGVSQMRFAETSSGGPAVNLPFPSPIAVLQAKTSFLYTWTDIPWEYLSANADVLVPTKILNCVGRVNSGTFLGFRRGTLLMQPPRFRVKPIPVAADDVTNPLRYVDAVLNFQHFDPEKGPAGGDYFGHNALPWRGNLKYYGAYREDGTTRLLPEADFTRIFEHVSKP